GKPQNGKITGVVYDEKGLPLPGATIRLLGTQSTGTVTDDNGHFTLQVTSTQDELVISFIGYKAQTVKLNGKTDIRVKLEPESLEMETVIATGYYPKAKNSFTGTAVVVNGNDLRNVNNTSFFDALKVFDPSFKVIDERGMYGSDPNRVPDRIEIRGQNSFPEISESNLKTVTSLPVFILDGFEISVEKVYDLDMNRIASVTILKDASAAAIYGSRAANGVIVIESKNPEAGKLQISYTFNGSLQVPDLSSYNLMNAAEALEFQRLAGVFDASEPGEDAGNKLNSYNVIRKEIMSGVNTYWLSKPLQVSFQHRHSLFIEGSVKKQKETEGTLRYQINLSGGGTKGVMKGSERNQISAGTKLLYQHKKLNITNDLHFSRVTSQESPYGSFSSYTQALPYHREKDENGKYYRTLSLQNVAPEGMTLGISDQQLSPVYEAKYLSSFTTNENLDFYNNFGINWEVVSGLRLKGNFKISNETNRMDVYQSPMSYSYIRDNDNTVNDPNVLFHRGQYTLGNSSGLTLSGNVVVSYTLNINKHLFQGIVGGELKQQDSRSDSYVVTGFMNDA
ncbi:MAG: carboxypeptidase-like regulatory domain-containing protein, partial [Odoribacter sp.]|nr:carboxypeptidase-like regulatory domain-containing protein [Odoribacter sp.]